MDRLCHQQRRQLTVLNNSKLWTSENIKNFIIFFFLSFSLFVKNKGVSLQQKRGRGTFHGPNGYNPGYCILPLFLLFSSNY